MKKKKPAPKINHSNLHDLINQAHRPEKPHFLPVTNPDFTKCSNALKYLLPVSEYHRDTPGRRLPLPSSVLPPLI